jgi:hypothetical protein
VVLNEPKPGQATLSPFFVDETTWSKKAPIVRSASAFDTPADSATASTSSALVMDIPSDHEWTSRDDAARWLPRAVVITPIIAVLLQASLLLHLQR